MAARVPAPESETQRLSFGALALLIVLGLSVRGLALWELRHTVWHEVLLGDARVYDDWARTIAAGEWFGREVFYQAPLYPYFLGSLYALFGAAPALARSVQIVLGALAAVLIGAAAARLFSRRAGLVAGVLVALYAPAIWLDLLLQKTSLEFFLTAVLVYALSSPRAWTVPARAAAMGGLLALLTLSRENSAILVLPLAWGFARASGERRARLASAVACLSVFALVLLPVGLRNARLGGTFLPTASNAGVNFYIGNAADADGLYRPLVAGRGHADLEREDARRWAERTAGRPLSPAGVSWQWFRLAGGEIAEEPGHFLRLLGRKAALVCGATEIMDAEALEAYRDEVRVLAWLRPVGFGLLFPLAVLGAAALARERSRGMLLPCAACLALSIVFFFVTARFRIALVPFLAPFAGAGVVALPALVRERRIAALAAGLAALALAHLPLRLPGDPRATTHANLASELLRRGDDAGAERWARAAVERDPGSAEAAFNLGLALRHLGRDAEAEAPFRSALELESAYAADALAELGAIRAVTGDRRGAAALLEQALALDPGHERARTYLEQLRREEPR